MHTRSDGSCACVVIAGWAFLSALSAPRTFYLGSKAGATEHNAYAAGMLAVGWPAMLRLSLCLWLRSVTCKPGPCSACTALFGGFGHGTPYLSSPGQEPGPLFQLPTGLSSRTSPHSHGRRQLPTPSSARCEAANTRLGMQGRGNADTAAAGR